MSVSARERDFSGLMTAAALAILLAILSVLSLVPASRGALEARLESATGRALGAFALARGLNAAVSVLQETEVGFTLGVSMTVEPGQALDPLNDLVERFSLAALAAAAVLGALRLLVDLFAWGGLQLALWAWMALAAALAVWRGAAAALLLRPLAAVATVWTFAWLTPLAMDWVHQAPPVAERYAGAEAALQQARQRLGALPDSAGLPDRESLERWIDDVSELAEGLSRRLLVQLSTFLLEILLVPLAAFWVASRAVSGLLRAPFGHSPS